MHLLWVEGDKRMDILTILPDMRLGTATEKIQNNRHLKTRSANPKSYLTSAGIASGLTRSLQPLKHSVQLLDIRPFPSGSDIEHAANCPKSATWHGRHDSLPLKP
eukprot:1157093-Pelagomonas_calceolata.AAC.8